MTFPWFPDVPAVVGARFWAKVRITPGCWLWLASKRHKGYGAFCFTRAGKVINGRAHRISYEIHTGEVPQGLMVLHRCDNPACLNPAHLFLGTGQENVDDMMQKGRHVSGSTHIPANLCEYKRGNAHHAARLTPEIVRAIRRDWQDGYSVSELNARYGTTGTHAWKIATGKLWRHVV